MFKRAVRKILKMRFISSHLILRCLPRTFFSAVVLKRFKKSGNNWTCTLLTCFGL